MAKIQKFGWLSMIAVLAIVISVSPTRLVYDEHFHIDLARLVQKVGWIDALRSPNNESAAGPLYPAVHWLASPLTNFQAPAIRLVNLFLVFVICFFVARILGESGKKQSWAASIFAIPFVWPTFGLALTEVPALAAFTGFLFYAHRQFESGDGRTSVRSTIDSVIAGGLLGIAILGRQTYLAIVPVLLLLAVTRKPCRSFNLVTATVAVLCSAWLFVVWGGLVPPSTKRIQGSLHFTHVVLACAYAGAASSLFKLPPIASFTRQRITALLVGSVAIVAVSLRHATPPAIGLVHKLMGESLGNRVAPLIWVAMVGLGLNWLFELVEYLRSHLSNMWSVFLCSGQLALALTTLKISIFSSRYIVGMSTLIVVYGVSAHPPKKSDLIRLVGGSCLGIATLFNYYYG